MMLALALTMMAQPGPALDFECSIPGGAKLQPMIFHVVAPVDKSRTGYRTNATQTIRADGSIDASYVSAFETVEDTLPKRLSLGWRFAGDAHTSITITDFVASAKTARFRLEQDQTGAFAALGPIVLEGDCVARAVTS